MNLPIRFSTLVLASAALLIPAAATFAQTADWSAQARDYLLQEAADYLPDHVLANQPMLGSLRGGTRQSRRVRLQSGVEYAIVGACDDDCVDLDLYLYDSRGSTLIDADQETDNRPMVTITPSATGNYRIDAEMYACSSEPCYYAIGVFQR